MFDLIKLILMNRVIQIGMLIGVLYTIGVETGLISDDFRNNHSGHVYKSVTHTK